MGKEETDMNDFLTEKNKKTGVLGKLKWVLCGFFILFSLGAIEEEKSQRNSLLV